MPRRLGKARRLARPHHGRRCTPGTCRSSPTRSSRRSRRRQHLRQPDAVRPARGLQQVPAADHGRPRQVQGRRRRPRLQPGRRRDVPPGAADIVVDLPSLTTVLEGKHRPGHFKGVCQVVAKLFNIVTPQRRVLRREGFPAAPHAPAMVEALDWPIEIVALPDAARAGRAGDEQPQPVSLAPTSARARCRSAARPDAGEGARRQRRQADEPAARDDAEHDARRRQARPRSR